MTIEYIHLTNDNAISLILKEDGSAVDLASTTRVTLELDSVIDSDAAGFGAGLEFDVTTGSGILVIRLGQETIVAGNYQAELIIYDSAHPNGLVWCNVPIIVQ